MKASFALDVVGVVDGAVDMSTTIVFDLAGGGWAASAARPFNASISISAAERADQLIGAAEAVVRKIAEGAGR